MRKLFYHPGRNIEWRRRRSKAKTVLHAGSCMSAVFLVLWTPHSKPARQADLGRTVVFIFLFVSSVLRAILSRRLSYFPTAD